MSFFFDTYALIELISGNPRYKKYEMGRIVTTKMNLMELYYSLVKETHPNFAEKYYEFFSKFTIKIDDDIIKLAMEFKSENKKKKLSYVDCVGYVIARSLMIKFLTGDKEFKDMEGVEFVK